MTDRRAAKAAAKKKDNPSAKRKKTETKIAIVDSTIACRHCRSYTISRATCAIFEYASFDDETLNSELDGEDGADPDEWYIETEASPDTTDVNASLDEVGACEEPEEAASDESDGGGGEDGAALLARQKTNSFGNEGWWLPFLVRLNSANGVHIPCP
ncbi:hypothetical protein JG687_00018848 [Phytophthora cactorum]|uniref:Uncharacterized protein n=1 Tax=Phytophthora cactorum TaxID=29920 RepID=A0A8T1TJY5_9STRA|nr:hypothetical protein JG687_00018848 [Phytophthora cactorum]